MMDCSNMLSHVIDGAHEAAGWAREAREHSTAARYVRCALQVNPFAYLERHARATVFADETSYNEAVVRACVDQGIEAIGVTDHYEIDSSQGLIETAAAAGIIAFPGFEAASSDGVHLLILFETGTSAKDIGRAIGACGVIKRESESPISECDAVALMAKAREWNAACVAAHVAGPGGLLKLKGQARIRAWQCEDLQAVALAGPVKDAPKELVPILRNKNAEHRRERLPAVLNAGDVCDPADLATAGCSCWIKMSDISVRALRMAFLDPESRVRLASEELPAEHPSVLAMRWQGGFLDGISLAFSADMTVLIGAPGAGKSTVIESLRFALGTHLQQGVVMDDHEGIVRRVLGPGATVTVLLSRPHPSPAQYLVERTVGHPPTVLDAETGELLALTPADLTPLPEIYGQHEISLIARDAERRTALLERFRERDPRRERRLVELEQELQQSRAAIIASGEQLAGNEARLVVLPRIEETLDRYTKAGVEEHLGEQAQLVTERQLIAVAREEVKTLGELAETVEDGLPPAPVEASEERDGKIAAKLATELNEALEEAGKTAAKTAGALREAAVRAMDKIDTVAQGWRERERDVEKKLNAALRKLEKENVNGEEFIELRAQLEELRPLRTQLARQHREREKLRARRQSQLVERERLIAAEIRALRSAARSATRRLRERVRITVQGESGREPLAAAIDTATKGRMRETLQALRDGSDLSGRELAELARAGTKSLLERMSIPATQAAKLAELPEATLLELEEIVFVKSTSIELNLARDGDEPRWEQLENLSKGQKATAILLLLLLDSAGPLVVDQPEDDLDNTFISEDVVPSVRREKPKRQFVFSTHNANLPVLGDAELIVGLSPAGEAGDGRADVLPGHIGSIDLESVRRLVEERLEGGHAAFELRRRKYGI
jgi:hypothetical protein